MNKSDPALFRKQVSQYRGFAGRLSMQTADNFVKLQAIKDAEAAIGFPYPPGTANPVPQLDKVVRGIAPQPAEMETAERRALERGILLTASRATGNPDDPARTQEFLKPGNGKVPRATFDLAMANALYEEAMLFGRQKLDQPEKMQILLTRAQEVLKGLPEARETKDLGAKIQGELKKVKKT
jgi:hypothetical protein